MQLSVFLDSLEGSRPLAAPVSAAYSSAAALNGSSPSGPKAASGPSDRPGDATLLESETLTKRPSLYKVLLLNDDYTPMEFVVRVLMGVFGKSEAEATQVMLMVHNEGVGVCGIYTLELAEAKADQVMQLARKQEHPLLCRVEKEG